MKSITLFSAIAILFAFMSSTTTVHAQLQKVNVGALPILGVGTAASKYAPGTFENVLLNVNFITKSTYHNAIYDFVGQQAVIINGWVYNSTQDIYLVTGKYVQKEKKGGTLGLGWEYALSIGNQTTCFFFVEYDTNWNDITDVSKHYASFGVIFPFAQWTVWKKK